MTARSSNGTGGGLSNATATWAGGVVPIEGDSVTIVAGDTVTLSASHVWGDDTANAIVVNGVLKASRSVSSQLTCKGQIWTALSLAAEIDFGKPSDPIPAGVTATLILNYSAVLVDNKWGLFVANKSVFNAWGAARQVNTTLVNGIAAGATSAIVADASGWAAGDRIVLAETDGNAAHDDVVILGTVNPGSGAIAFPAIAYAHAAGAPVGHFTGNVTFKAYYDGVTRRNAFVCFTSAYDMPSNSRSLKYAAFEYIGAPMDNVRSLFSGGTQPNPPAWSTFASASFYQVGSNIGGGQVSLYNFVSSGVPLTLDNLAVYNTGTNNGLYPGSSSYAAFTNCVVYRVGYNGLQSDYSQGLQGTTFTNCKFWATSNTGMTLSPAIGAQFTNCQFHAMAYLYLVAGNATFNGCDFGSASLPGTPNVGTLWNAGGNGLLAATFTNCKFPAAGISYTNMSGANPAMAVSILNRNQDVTLQDLYTPQGEWHRDNSVFSRGKSSVRLDTKTSKQNNYPAISLPAPNGNPVTVKLRMRKNAAYGSATLPFATLSGLGITPVVATLADVADTWQDFTLSATNTSGADGMLSLVFSGQSGNSAGACWFDGVYQSPFITAVDHYGYLYDPGNAVRTLDPVIQQPNESVVATTTGIAIAAGTITLSQSHSVRELYDTCQLYRVANHLAPFLSSADGVNFNCSYNLVLNGGNLTGAGAIAMASNSFTRAGAETSSVTLTHNAGVFTSLGVTGLVAGSRVQLYDVTAGVELFNAVVAGTAMNLNATWTANHTIRCRVAYVSGLSAKLPWSATGVFAATGLSFLAAQVDDRVYIGNAIDGASVTEYVADYATVKIDISDSDGIAPIQRGYAWFCNAMMSGQGIATYFGALVAEDAVNYALHQEVIPVKIRNTGTIATVFSGARLYCTDGSSPFVMVPGDYPLSLNPDKAYMAAGTAADIANAVWNQTLP